VESKKKKIIKSKIENEAWPTITVVKGALFKFENISKENVLKNYLKVVDFEDHLNDISLDFLDQKL
jgi:hypothetical protein